MKFLIAFLFLSGILFATSSSDSSEKHSTRAKWNLYKKTYGKRYHSSAEESVRFSNFLKTEAMIKEHNKNYGSTFEMEHNYLSDWHKAEKTALTGTIPPIFNTTQNDETSERFERQIPTSYDLRNAKPGCVGTPKNQGQCGSCWAFSAIASLECSYFLKYGKILILSEQQLVSCDVGNNDFGCNGGFYTRAWKYLQTAGGSEKSSDYPYTSAGGANGTCKFSLNKVAARVANYNIQVNSAVASIQNALLQYGTLSAAITVVDSFYTYKTGVYTDSTCTAKPINHAVNIIGWGSNYWIVRNSWGSSWGNGGYVFVAKGANMCNIEKYVYAVTVQ